MPREGRVVCLWGSGLRAPSLDLEKGVEGREVNTDRETVIRSSTGEVDLLPVGVGAPTFHPPLS